MKKYITLILTAFLVCSMTTKAQKSITFDSISLKIDSMRFKRSKSGKDLFEYVPQTNDLIAPDHGAIRNAQRAVTAVPPLPSMSPMSLSQIPYNYTIDKTKGVGEITISSNVANGTASHNVPIETYAAGLQPQLSISYNSMAANNIAGYGWNVGGVSTISVVNSNYYYDGTDYKPVTLNKSVSFALDGMRLIKISESSAQINYQSEQGNVKVISHIPAGEYYFEVFYPDGRKATFGYKTKTSAFKLFYPMTKMEDLLSNYIDYTYSESGNVYYLSNVKYGTKSAFIGSIDFTYQTVSNAKESYMGGEAFSINKLLTGIKTYFQSNLLRTYTLTHEKKQYNFLTKISCKAGTQELNPLLFYYGSDISYGGDAYFQTGTTLLESYFENSKAPDLILNKGKFNSQTTSDGLVAYPNFQTYAITAYDKKGNCTYGSSYSTTQDLLIFKDLGTYFCDPIKRQTGNGFQKLMPADIDGDGDDELVRVNYWLHDKSNAKLHITTYNKDMTSSASDFLLEGTFRESDLSSVVPRTFLFGDFNGDGKTELIAISGYKMPKKQNGSAGEVRTYSRTTMINLQNKTKIYDQLPFKYDYFEDYVFAVDFDGDGKTDICLINEKGTYIYSFQDGDFKQIAETDELKKADLIGKRKRELLLGDINGDGIIDFLLSPKKDDYIEEIIRYEICGKCTKCNFLFYSQPLENPHNPNTTYGDDYHSENHAGHIDSAGIQSFALIDPPFKPILPEKPKGPFDMCLSPIPIYKKTYNNTYKTWIVLFSTGKKFQRKDFNFLSNSDVDYKFLLQDINGDHLPDLVVKDGTTIQAYLNNDGEISTTAEKATVRVESDAHFISGGIGEGLWGAGRPSHILSIKDARVTPITFSRNDARERMLTGVINSLGVVSKYDYSNLTSGSNYSVLSSNTVSFPYQKLYMDMNVVSSTSVSVNNQIVASNTYDYNDAVIHRQGGGFKGFSKITIHDKIRNIDAETCFSHLKFGTPLSSNSPTASATYNYTATTAANKITKVLLTSQVEKDKLTGNTLNTSYEYDSHGNMTSKTDEYGGTLKTTTTQKTTNYTGTPYLLGLPAEVLVANFIGTNKVENKTEYKYDKDLVYLLTSKKEYYNDNLVAEESYTYDNNKNLSQKGIKPYAATTYLYTKYVYDTFGRLTKQTEPLGLYTENAYNPKGELVTVKDHKGLETKYTYNDWGAPLSTTYPDGSTTSVSNTWSTYGLVCKTETGTGKPTKKQYIDALGQVLRTGEIRFDGKELKTDYLYDNRSRLSKLSLPYTGASATLWNTYDYTIYDRINTLTYASGKKDSYLYFKNTISMTIDGVSTMQTVNALGQIVSLFDDAGTIKYNYRPDNQLESIVAVGNITTKFEYDKYGRKTAIVDPSAGRRTYTYDDFGNVLKETAPGNKTITMSYDAYNRPEKKIIDGVTTSYKYNVNGLIESVTSTNGTAQSITYDSKYYDRPIAQKETIVDGKWLEKTFAYNATTGVSESTTYKSSESPSIGTESYIYANGHLKEIKFAEATVWRLDAETVLGKPAQVTTGALTRTYTYDQFGLPTGRAVKAGTTVIQNFGYDFDKQTGNLNWRKDNTKNILENFSYDAMNRLTTFAGKTVKYAPNGNILDISTIGTFGYDSRKPYAIAQFTPYGTSQIPLRAQTVTYNSMMRPNTITENNYTSTFWYDTDGTRLKMVQMKSGADDLTRYYLGGSQYEIDKGIAGAKERLYIGGDTYSAAAVYVKEGGSWSLNYICRDYLGSITHVTNASGALRQELSYDAWGRLRNPANQAVYAAGSEPVPVLGRGYTGHEHLAVFGLINMNARIYDPVLGRFLSPDPYVQNPYNSQNFNRYSYCLNNPLKYNDQSGEIIGFVTGAFKGIVNFGKGIGKWAFDGGNFRRDVLDAAWKPIWNGIKIDGGLFTGDPTQILSRFIWELPQTLAGYATASLHNAFGGVKDVSYYGGATVIESYSTNGAIPLFGKGTGVTMGSFIIGERGIKADPKNPLFQHEYGHYLQSRASGWFYIPKYAIPSLSSAKKNDNNHRYFSVELDANARALNYFGKRKGADFIRDDWNFNSNPIRNYNRNYDFSDPINQQAIRDNIIAGSWRDAIPLSWIPIINITMSPSYNNVYDRTPF